MAIIKCKMCGGDIVLAEDKTYGTCEYCGSTMTFPKVSDEQKLNLFNRQYEMDTRPIEEGCGCPACRSYTRAYIRHLLKAKEMLGMRLCVLHNLYYYNHLMEQIREAIEARCYQAFKKETLERFKR